MNFETSEVYELIDGILCDGVDFDTVGSEPPYGECRFCYERVRLKHNGVFMSYDKAKEELVHQPKCPYTLAESMNVGRDYEKFPVNEGDYE